MSHIQFLPSSEVGSKQICGEFGLTGWDRHLWFCCRFIREARRAASRCPPCLRWAVLPLQRCLSRIRIDGKLRDAFPSAQGDPGGTDLGRPQWCRLLGVLSSFPVSLLPLWGEAEVSGCSGSMLQWSLQTPCSSSVCQAGCSQVKGLGILGISVPMPKV